MHILLKAVISLAIILAATEIGRKLPSLAGLIGVMPLTVALVLVWVHLENQGDPQIMQTFVKGAIGGIVPSILFFFAAFLCFKKALPLPLVLSVSFGAWLAGAFVHQWALR